MRCGQECQQIFWRIEMPKGFCECRLAERRERRSSPGSARRMVTEGWVFVIDAFYERACWTATNLASN